MQVQCSAILMLEIGFLVHLTSFELQNILGVDIDVISFGASQLFNLIIIQILLMDMDFVFGIFRIINMLLHT